MSRINILDAETVNQIAAGEVVERPRAVVKELVENAIDAKATMITVEIKEGGISFIRITDNGSGIAAQDMELAFTAHATSKIAGIGDLQQISSLGFRGEALSSIAAVSMVEAITKTRDAVTGIRYVIEGGEAKQMEEIGCPDGTTFIIRNLFFNTPARRKFLKTAATEGAYISDLMERLAISNPGVACKLIVNGQVKLQTSGNGNIRDIIYHIYGRDIQNNLIELPASEGGYRLTGYIGKPVISRGNRSYMTYFVNGRYVKSPIIDKAILDSYKPYVMQHRFPFVVLWMETPPRNLDVNVHPTKMEVRFDDGEQIYTLVQKILSEALSHKELIPEVSFGREEKKKQPPKTSSVNHGKTYSDKPIHGAEPFETKRLAKEPPAAYEKHLEKFKEPKRFIPGHENVSSKIEPKLPDTDNPSVQEKNPAPPNEHSLPQTDSKQSKPQQSEMTLIQQDGSTAPPAFSLIGQLFQTYWIVEFEGEMLVIDQHAAHEKILYEHLMEQISSNKPATQMINPPMILSLSMTEEQIFLEHQEVFEQLGFAIAPFGGREYAVNGVPFHLPTLADKDLLMEIFDELSVISSKKAAPEILLNKIATMACKAAVKGNQKLSAGEAVSLIEQLMTLENPYHCPHGRPTMIRMSKYELEKKFKRIV